MSLNNKGKLALTIGRIISVFTQLISNKVINYHSPVILVEERTTLGCTTIQLQVQTEQVFGKQRRI